MTRALMPHMIEDHGYEQDVVLAMSVSDLLNAHEHDHDLAAQLGVDPHEAVAR